MIPEGFALERVIPLKNNDYPTFVANAIHQARHRVWAVNFYVDPRNTRDDQLAVREFITELGRAKWRGADVRILLGNSNTLDIHFGNDTAKALLLEYGVDTRIYQNSDRSSIHSKYVIVDNDLIVVGSHNWTPDAFAQNDEDSIAAYSSQLCNRLADEFNTIWLQNGE